MPTMAPSKVTKKRSDSKPPIQFWAGKTYACNACKRGHRVKSCDHGKDGKPISATNQPGRPSSGSDRKCTCPKTCSCTTNCKCVKDGCLCVQRMFLVVALKSRPKPEWIDEEVEPAPQWTDGNGEEKTLNPVYVDMTGKVIPAEKARAMEEEKERRRTEGESKQQPAKSCCASKEVKEEQSPTPTPGCRHRETVPVPKTTPVTLPSNTATRCTCGVKCQCTLCPEHPNNAATRSYNAEQLGAMAANHTRSYLPTQSIPNGQLYTPEIPQGSCLGGQASYMLTRTRPTLHDFQRMFPGHGLDDNLMLFPINAPTHLYNQMNGFDQGIGPADPFQSQTPAESIPELDQLEPFDDMSFFNQPLEYTFGDADVTTFGQPLASPTAMRSPSHLRHPSDLIETHDLSTFRPPDLAADHINPHVLHAPPAIPLSPPVAAYDDLLFSDVLTNYDMPPPARSTAVQPQAPRQHSCCHPHQPPLMSPLAVPDP
jgi:hypothetical protein